MAPQGRHALTRIFFRSAQKKRAAERMGTGTRDMIRLCLDAGLREPQVAVRNGFVQTLWRPPRTTPTAQAIRDDKSLSPKRLQPASRVPGMPTAQATAQVGKILAAADVQEGRAREELQAAAGISHPEHFRKGYLEPMIQVGWIERTLPSKPTSPHQRYRLTPAGRAWLATSTLKEGT